MFASLASVLQMKRMALLMRTGAMGTRTDGDVGFKFPSSGFLLCVSFLSSIRTDTVLYVRNKIQLKAKSFIGAPDMPLTEQPV